MPFYKGQVIVNILFCYLGYIFTTCVKKKLIYSLQVKCDPSGMCLDPVAKRSQESGRLSVRSPWYVPAAPLQGVYCGQKSPFTIKTTGNFITIKFTSDSSVKKGGFTVRYTPGNTTSCYYYCRTLFAIFSFFLIHAS